ncbi:MAG: restriction endonuclease subunit S [Shewanella sp.]|nr:restriction endonuclease subunit S [Shewanella sp.]
MRVEKKVPEIRFKGFEGEWKLFSLGELGSVATNKRIFIHQTSLIGDVPFYKIGTFGREPKMFISQELFEDYKKRYPFPEKGDLLFSVIGSIGRVVEYTGEDEYFQDSNVVWLQHNGSIVNSFLKQFYSIVEWEGIEGSTIKHLYNRTILGTKIQTPTREEQTKIGNTFQKIDSLINQHQQKHDKLSSIKKAMLEKMFPKQGETIPEIRFKGGSGAWEVVRLSEAAPLRGGFAFQSFKFSDSGVPIVKISNILPTGEVGGKFNYFKEINNDENYLLLDGSALLAMSGATTGKVSILRNSKNNKFYQNQRVGYFQRDIEFDYLFISTLVRSHIFKDKLDAVLVAGAQPNVSSKEIDSFEFMMPSDINEQAKLGNYFQKLDELINQHQQQITKLNNVKQACLSKMFV